VSKLEEILQNTPNRRSFLKQGVVAGATVAGAGILGSVLSHASTQKSSSPTTGDIAILRFLASRAGEVVTRDDLLNEVWGYESYPSSRTVDNHVAGLRAKLERDSSQPQHIKTVHGVGYKFVL